MGDQDTQACGLAPDGEAFRIQLIGGCVGTQVADSGLDIVDGSGILGLTAQAVIHEGCGKAVLGGFQCCSADPVDGAVRAVQAGEAAAVVPYFSMVVALG